MKLLIVLLSHLKLVSAVLLLTSKEVSKLFRQLMSVKAVFGLAPY
jgi:hypothetical protein